MLLNIIVDYPCCRVLYKYDFFNDFIGNPLYILLQ